MSFVPNFPPSLLAKVNEDEAGETKKKSKEDYRKMKELEEARKSATVPAMKDEEGRDINPHIPQYIMSTPWYYGAMHPTLNHQRLEVEGKVEKGNKWYKRGIDETKRATKFRKGACENCGAMGHKRKDCLERPRKVRAKYSGRDMAPDDFVQPNLQLDYESKRDRWNGYDSTEHKKVYEEAQRLEEARRLVREKQVEEQLQVELGAEGGSEVAEKVLKEDEDKYGDELDMPGQKFDSKQRHSIRNLRIREDTPKYLHNLDPNSAYYDPKTRSMRVNPFGADKAASEVPYAGDNFVRFQGDALKMMEEQVFAWDMHDQRGLDTHLQADPTRLELLARKVKEANSKVSSSVREEILDKYGGREHLETPPKDLLLAQSETYVEYSRSGKVVKGAERPVGRSRFEEDIFPGNHTSVWGSFWHNGKWGFRCCHSLIKESFCLGEKGKTQAIEEAPAAIEAPPRVETEEERALREAHEAARDETKRKRREKKREKKKSRKEKKRKRRRKSSSSSARSSSSESEDEDTPEEKVKKEVAKEKKRQAEIDRLLAMDERKRPYNSMYEAKMPTDEEMEAFYRTRLDREDPLTSFGKK